MSISITDIVNSAKFKEAVFSEASGMLVEILRGVADSLSELSKLSSSKMKTSPSKSKASPKSEPEEEETDTEEGEQAEETEPEEESSDSEEEQKPAPKGKSKSAPKTKTAEKSKTTPKSFDFSTVKEATIVNEGFSNKSFVILGEELRTAFPDIKTRWSDKLSTGAGLVVDKSLLKDVLAILKKQKVAYTLASKDEVTAAKSKTSAPKGKADAKSKTSAPKGKAASKSKTAEKEKPAPKGKSGATAPSKLKKNRWGNLEEVDNTSGVVYYQIAGSHVAVGTQDTGVKVSVKGLASVNGLSAEEKKDIEKRGFTVLTEELAKKAPAKVKESLLDLLEPESEDEEPEPEESEAEESEAEESEE